MSNTHRPSSSPETARIKYRAACDHCSSTKTKCTQERPSCQRCLALGRDCNYSRSLRAGKPPRSSKKLKQKSTAPVLPRPAPHLSFDLSADSPGQAWSNATTPYPTPALTPSNGPMFFSTSDPTSHDSGSSSQSLSPIASNWLLDYNHGNDLFTDYKPPSPHPAILESHTRLQFASPISEMGGEFEELARFHANPSPPKPISETDECVRIATNTLTTLYSLPMTPTSGACSNTRQPSMDEVLDATALALQNLHTVIAYACPKDFTLPMVILSIASKLLAWYQAVVRVQDPYTQGFETSKEVVLEASRGGDVNDRFGWVMTHQVVQGHLHSFSGVLSGFRGSYCTEGASEGGMMFASMESHLRNRLMVTMQEIDARLRSCVE